MSTTPSHHQDAASAEAENPPKAPLTVLAATLRREKRMMMLFFTAMLAFGAVCWHVYPHAAPLAKQWLARRHLPALYQHLSDENLQAAAALLRDARRWAPDDPEVLHASLAFTTRPSGDPRGTLSIIRRLQEMDAATTEDLILMGQAHVRLGEIAKAREIFDQLPTAARQQQHGLELHADLLQAAGQNVEASEARHAALQSAANGPESLRKLAVLDLNSSDPARRKTMSAQLWQAARSGGPTSLVAIELLAQIKELTVPQLDELLHLVEAAAPTAPAASAAPARQYEAARFSMFSARLRLTPHLRSELVDQEIMRWKKRPLVQTSLLLNWLASEHEYARILRMVPAQTVARYTDLLPAYVDALRGTGQWQALNTLLASGGIDPAFSPPKIRLWQAEAQIHLHPEPAQARQTILRIFEEAGRGDDPTSTFQAGSLAEQLNQWDLAEKCYEAIAAKHSGARLAMLTKVYQMANCQHDGPGMLHACSRLLVLQPESHALLTQRLYLQLLLGIQIELAQQELNTVLQSGVARTDHLCLLQALAAYRDGQPSEAVEFLGQVTHPEAFAIGERSVYAALLKSTGGDVGKAFRLVERISPALLLPEEKLFLKRAL
jgi:tetratricopeptide (TPR) repeat protein